LEMMQTQVRRVGVLQQVAFLPKRKTNQLSALPETRCGLFRPQQNAACWQSPLFGRLNVLKLNPGRRQSSLHSLYLALGYDIYPLRGILYALFSARFLDQFSREVAERILMLVEFSLSSNIVPAPRKKAVWSVAAFFSPFW